MFLSIISLLTGVGILFWGINFLFSKEYFLYHSEATRISWNDIDEKLKYILLVFMKVIGVGSITISIFIISTVIYLIYIENEFIQSLIFFITSLYLLGLFLISYSVFIKTKANTPWKRMLFWFVINFSGFLISILLL